MKIILASFTLLFSLLFQPALAQEDSRKLLVQEYIKQSERQKKTGIILLTSGVGATLLGTVLFGIGWGNGSDVAGGSGVMLMTAGSIATLVSIPILIGSASSARKAGKLSLDIAQIEPLHRMNAHFRGYPALKFSLPLNSQKR
ncbi:hypothetical protein [Algoriphagus confluentis]|uniref:Uncharacterized protein n=1 Tax=Algoriphagus confluentis TaxID=1697556 RepID=A0ABQ6PVU3_9BACT|nr:hypothetical protein Aconfl_39570 [Algoriphagus confluentis]